ncbi:MAG: RidA family protein [Alphaproteobacteria bacterium]|nr:MAG: RidA family protein [Alphaproteobacteria bacterium]
MTARLAIASRSPYEKEIGFSRAVRMGSLIFVGGTAPIGPDRKPWAVGDPGGQARRCLEIIAEALAQAGAGLEHVVRTRMFITDVAHWEAVGRAHGEVFGAIRPASTMVQVAGLLEPEWLVEIEADAVLPQAERGGV